MESPDAPHRSATPRTRSHTGSRSGTPEWHRRSPSTVEVKRRSFSRSISRQKSRSQSRSRSHSYRRDRSRSGSRNGYGKYRSSRRHLGSRDDPDPCKCIGIFGLSVYTTERQLEDIFSKYGPIEKVQVVLDAKTGKSRGFAFIYYESIKDATAAKNECTGMEIDGRRIRVDYSITQRPHTPTPGIYMGRSTINRGSYDRGYDRASGSSRGGGYRDRYRSPSPRYHSRSGRDRDYYDRGYDRYDRYERSYDRGYDRYDRGYDRYDRGYDKYDKYDRGYDRSRSRSYSPRRYKY